MVNEIHSSVISVLNHHFHLHSKTDTLLLLSCSDGFTLWLCHLRICQWKQPQTFHVGEYYFCPHRHHCAWLNSKDSCVISRFHHRYDCAGLTGKKTLLILGLIIDIMLHCQTARKVLLILGLIIHMIVHDLTVKKALLFLGLIINRILHG